MKTGWKTSEFWVTVASIVGLVVSAAAAGLSPRYAAIGATVSGAAYAVSRGLAKLFPQAPAPPAPPAA
jgi:hypothetical protein